MRPFFSDMEAADTIPLKLVVYVGLLAAVLILLAQAWYTVVPTLEDAEIKAQTEAASMSILSIQGGYARDSADRESPDGSMCTLELSLPTSIRYVSFGMDPDPECNGNLSDSRWVIENNTIIYQYQNGVKKKVFLGGKPVHFVKGKKNPDGIWIPTADLKNNEKDFYFEKTAVVIEYPVSGQFVFEMFSLNDVRYTMSQF
jgi:hypothetical protein